MRWLQRIGLALLAGLLLVVLVVGIYTVVQVRRPFPTTEGTVAAAGLEEEVRVYRDEYGIPHIYAETPRDLFFAQGYVHAQDRFWQMEFWRHVGQGRLSEIAGDSLVDTDKFIRTMGWNRIAKETLAYYEEHEPEMMAVLESYSAGVNAYIEDNPDALSLNMTILDLVNEPREIEPWTPLDTIGWSVVMSDDLGGNWEDELQRMTLIKAVGEERAAELMPLYPENRPVIAPTAELSAGVAPSPASSLAWGRVATEIIGAVPENGFALGAGEFVGSNNWVIGGQHTESGEPLLADDPHLGIQMPSIWYEVGLHAPGWNVTGFSFAGVPGVVVGHNGRIAWGVTNVGPDVQDLFIEKVNPQNPYQYEFMGEWRDMEVHQEVIKVNGGEDVTLEVRETHHGPIISEVVDGTEDVLSMQWSADAAPSRLLKSVLGLNQAQGYEEFREALRYWDVPAQNFVYADVEGNIAYQMPGLIPIRRNGNGLLPVPGWSGEYEWEGWVPYEELPAILNPEKGFIVTANNAVVDEEYPYLIELQWSDGDRALRIEEMIEEMIAAGQDISAEEIALIHMDSKSLLAERYLPLLTDLQSDDPEVMQALEHLQNWDFQLRRDSVPAALWEIFYMHLQQATVADELDEEAADEYLGNGSAQRVLFHRLANDPGSAWWDDVETDVVETRDEVLLQAMRETIDWFEENLGGEMEEWEWGRIHTATFVSNPLGQSGIGLLERIVNRGPFPVDGGSSAVNANAWSWGNPAAVGGHVSMRMIVDLADFDDSLSVMPTGQSGHPFHPHYDDMIPLWLEGRYHPMLWSQEAVEAAAEDVLVLEPGQ